MAIIKKAIFALFAILITFEAFGFFGNDLLGPNACIIGCGRGPLGIAPLGDLMGSLNEFVFGPTLDSFEKKGKNIVDYAAQKTDEKLLTLDSNLNDKISMITDVAQDSISQLNDVLNSNINLGLEGLSRIVESFDILGSKQNDELNAMLRGIILLVTIAILTTWIAKTISSMKGSLHNKLKNSRWSILTSIVTIIIVAIAPNFIPLLKYKTPGIQMEFEKKYETEFNRLSFQRAAYIAQQLIVIEPQNIHYLRARDISSVLRDVYFNPASYRTDDGLRTEIVKINSLLIPDDKSIQADTGKAFRLLDEPELEITLAMITWQVHHDMYSRLQAANLCAYIIERQLAKSGGQLSPLLPLANHYITSYLINPIDENEIKLIKEDEQQSAMGIYELNYPIKSISELRNISDKYQQYLINSKSQNTESSGSFVTLSRQIEFGKLTASTYKVAIPEYIEMLDAYYELSIAPPASKDALKALKNAHAKKIIASWDKYLSQSSNDLFSADLNLRLSMITALSATYERAYQYLDTEPNGSALPILNQQQIDAVPLEKSFTKQWLSNMSGMVRPTGMPLLQFRVKAQFILDQTDLHNFETSYLSFLADKSNLDKALAAASNASKLGLFICVATDKKKEDTITSIPCESPGAQSIRALWYIRSNISNNIHTTPETWKKSAIESLQRTPPII